MIESRRRRMFALFAAAAPAVLVPCAALAQTNTAAANSSQVAEVVVTAQKRSENLQAVPQQVNVVGTAELQDLHITQLADIGAYVPGLQVNSGGTPGQTTLSLRGIAPIGPSATVGTYIDDTPVGSTSVQAAGAYYSLDLMPYDVQRIEVLQGPQGTLYGANSIGGLIKYVLTSPDLNTFHGNAGVDVFGISHAGDAGGGGRLSVTGPIIPGTLGFLASYSSESTPGYINNIQTGQKGQNDYWQQSGRLALLWQPTNDISLKLGAVLQRIDAADDATVALDPTTLKPIGGELTDNNYLAEPSRSSLQHYSLEASWDLHWAKLISATSYSITSDYTGQDLTRSYGPLFPLVGAPAGTAPFSLDYITKKVTQELRLSSAPGDRIEWLVGGFYTHEDTKNSQNADALTFGGAPIPGLDPLLVAELPDTYQELAAFGDVTFHLTKKLDVSGGLRYAYNNQTFDATATGFLTGAASLSGTSHEGVLTYNFNPKYQFTKDIQAYLRIASGYQAGGPNIPYPGVPAIVKSDTLTNYELGLKSEFWDRRALLDVAVFYIDWQNIQVQGFQTGTGFTYLDNGGSAKSEGVSVDGSLQPIAGLTLSGNVTYTDAALTQAVPEIGGLSGDRLPYIPLWSGSMQANYSWALTSDVAAHVGAGVRLVGDRYSEVSSSPSAYRLGAYGALDLNADVTYKQYTARLFLKNATDTRAYDYDAEITNALTGTVAQLESTLIQPRTFGVALDAKF